MNKHGYCPIFLILERNSLEQEPIKLATQQIYLQQNYYEVYKLKIKLSREERIQLTMINDNNFHYVIYFHKYKNINNY